jgi:acyl-CoA thioesterase FadM
MKQVCNYVQISDTDTDFMQVVYKTRYFVQCIYDIIIDNFFI